MLLTVGGSGGAGPEIIPARAREIFGLSQDYATYMQLIAIKLDCINYYHKIIINS